MGLGLIVVAFLFDLIVGFVSFECVVWIWCLVICLLLWISLREFLDVFGFDCVCFVVLNLLGWVRYGCCYLFVILLVFVICLVCFAGVFVLCLLFVY